ncbi:uroporphyrinogen-III synthase [Virgibacillus sediminis]|uniref:Uroporphyrinogen-III synthase n=1 Tax=Virgibacillus sediminis TaxID=202260 RepID=A0ABV7A5Y2_9BACI
MTISLEGRKILITREVNQAKVFADKVKKYKGIPIVVPLLTVVCRVSEASKGAIGRLGTFKWIFFTSANGVRCFFQTLNHFGLDGQPFLKELKIAVVGHKTEDALKSFGYRADFIPSEYHAEAMGQEFLKKYDDPAPILLVRGNRSRNVLPDVFSKLNIPFDMIQVYETSFNFQMKEKLRENLKDGNIDYLTFTSPSAVESFCEMVDERKIPSFCIGTTTQIRAKELGFQETFSPNEFTTDSVLELISDYIAGKDR